LVRGTIGVAVPSWTYFAYGADAFKFTNTPC
jgi:hypothetical protein